MSHKPPGLTNPSGGSILPESRAGMGLLQAAWMPNTRSPDVSAHTGICRRIWRKGQGRQALDRMQMQLLIMPAPGRSNLIAFFKNDEIQAGFSKTGAYRRTRANDGNVSGFRQRRLPSFGVAKAFFRVSLFRAALFDFYNSAVDLECLRNSVGDMPKCVRKERLK